MQKKPTNRFFEIDSLEFYSEHLRLNENLSLKNENDSTVLLRAIIKEPKIIIYFDQYNCSSCYKSSFFSLQKIASNHLNRFIFIGKFDNFNELLLLADHYNIVFNKYNLNGGTMDIPMEKSKMPFVFYLDTALVVHNIFGIMKNQPRLNEKYIQFLLNID